MLRRAILPLAFLALAAQAPAYVTSAVLEYSVDDQAAFFLNGSPILKRSDFAPFDYAVLSTSDGTLPMEYFNSFGDNTLAVEDFDTEGGNISISYRFTVHTSDGDPIVIWSDPEQAKMLHLSANERDPEGWIQPNFDDSKWAPAKLATETRFEYFGFPTLFDASLGGIFNDPYVPRLSHTFNMHTNTKDHNLYRSHFKFPDKPAKVTASIRPVGAAMGQQVAVRLIPGPDSAEFSQFNVLAWVPQGLEMTSSAPGAKYDPKLRRLSWSYNRRDLQVGYAKMNLASVISATGWGAPQKALGPFKAGKGRRKLNTPDAIWNDGAVITNGSPGWFKVSPHNVDISKWRPTILGVIFRSQLRAGGLDTAQAFGVDAVKFNYSVDGGATQVLKDDAFVSRMSSNQYWYDGAYDATEDRKWTWEDLNNLSIKVMGTARGTSDRNLISALEVTVKYYTPTNASPWFMAKVTEPKCTTLQLKTGAFRTGSPLLTSDPVDLVVNAGACPPTPAPTPTFTPIPIAIMVKPTATAVPTPRSDGKIMQSDIRFGLEGLRANPDPVNFAGSFIEFSVTKDVNITLNVYSDATGKAVRVITGNTARAGNNQIFYNALDNNNKVLTPGHYTFEIVAEKNGHQESKQGSFEFTKARRKP
jgi:hypothetical protein